MNLSTPYAKNEKKEVPTEKSIESDVDSLLASEPKTTNQKALQFWKKLNLNRQLFEEIYARVTPE